MTDYPIIRFHALGGPEVLQLESAPMADPGPGEVRLAIRAIGVTQGDAMYRRGTYLEKPDLPSGLGTEVCGIVDAAGPGVTKFKVGDRVSSISTFSINKYPAYGSLAVLPVTALMATPPALSDEEGAAFTLAFLPMYLALVLEARLKVGDRVLINAAGATTSLAAAQIARLAGARPIGIVRTAERADALANAGYDQVLAWTDTVVEDVLNATDGGADIVLDPVVGPRSAMLSEMCRRRARIIHYGALAGSDAAHSIYQLAPKFLTVSGFTIYGYSGSSVMNIPRDDTAMRAAEEFVGYGVGSGALRPLIAERFPLAHAAAAHAALEQGSHIGKIVLTPAA
jgi:NADPH:quinone reductase